jgi:adenosylhomocysteinase
MPTQPSYTRVAKIAGHLAPAPTSATAQVETGEGVVNDPGFSGSYAGNYKIRDLNLAARGRKELLMAEVEMPGLMNCRKEFGASKPLAGARVMGSLHMTVQTAVLMETLHHLGADVRWATCNIFSTQDEAAAACVAAKSSAVYAWKGQTVQEYWECMDAVISWKDGEGMDIIVDDGGDVTLLIHEGFVAEQKFAKDPSYRTDAKGADNEEFACVLATINKSLEKDPTRFTRMVKRLVGVSEETTTGVHRLKVLANEGSLLFPAIIFNDSVTKSKFDNLYGTRHSLPDGLMRATDVMIAGKMAVVGGYGDVGKGSAAAMKACGARVVVTEIDPICALQACMEGYTVLTVEDVVEEADIFVTTTGNRDIITIEHMKKMKHNAIVANVGHFDLEIDVEGLYKAGFKKDELKPQTDIFTNPETGTDVIVLAEGRLMNLGCATGHPSFVMSNSFTNQVLAQLDLWANRNTGKYSNQVYLLSKELDEKVARLHLDACGAKLTRLTDVQADYIGVSKDGPYKQPLYRY